MEEEYTYEEFEDTYEAQPPKKQRKLWLWILVAVLAVAVLAVGAILILPKLGGSSAGDEWTLRNAYIASDKSAAYIILPDGESVKVKKDGIVSARITEDLKHIAVLLDDGTIWSCGSNYYGQLGFFYVQDSHIAEWKQAKVNLLTCVREK